MQRINPIESCNYKLIDPQKRQRLAKNTEEDQFRPIPSLWGGASLKI